MTFLCRAVEIPKKSVEQPRFEQLHFEQLTLTLNDHYIKYANYNLQTLKDIFSMFQPIKKEIGFFPIFTLWHLMLI